jgi:hypothetical protein
MRLTHSVSRSSMWASANYYIILINGVILIVRARRKESNNIFNNITCVYFINIIHVHMKHYQKETTDNYFFKKNICSLLATIITVIYTKLNVSVFLQMVNKPLVVLFSMPQQSVQVYQISNPPTPFQEIYI